jgi:hypothetical protein
MLVHQAEELAFPFRVSWLAACARNRHARGRAREFVGKVSAVELQDARGVSPDAELFDGVAG